MKDLLTDLVKPGRGELWDEEKDEEWEYRFNGMRGW